MATIQSSAPAHIVRVFEIEMSTLERAYESRSQKLIYLVKRIYHMYIYCRWLLVAVGRSTYCASFYYL